MLLICLAVPALPQAKAVSFKKLQQFLPTVNLPGFERQKPTGTSQTVMGISSSEASVEYISKPVENEAQATIKVTIQDATYMSAMLMQFSMLQDNYESETEVGYEKALKIKDKYPGKMSVQTGDVKSYSIEFGVNNRFYVHIEANAINDTTLVNSLLNKMDLEKLGKVEAEK